jgi:hypothetical protein
MEYGVPALSAHWFFGTEEITASLFSFRNLNHLFHALCDC